MDSKLQDKACYNDCYYKMKRMVTVIEVNKKDVKDSDSVADSGFSFLFFFTLLIFYTTNIN